MKKTFAIVLALILCLATLSCAKRQTVKEAELKAEEEAEVQRRGPVTTMDLRAQLAYNEITSIQSEVKVRVYNGDKSMGRFSGAFLYRSPGSIKLRLYDPFGAVLLDMLKAGSRLELYIPSHGTLYEGSTPPLGLPSNAVYSMEEQSDSYMLYAFWPGNSDPAACAPLPEFMELISKYTFSRRSLRNTDIDIYERGRKFMRMSFEDYSGRKPGRIRLSFFNGYVLLVELIEPTFDEEPITGAFDPVDRSGMRVRSIWSLLNESLL